LAAIPLTAVLLLTVPGHGVCLPTEEFGDPWYTDEDIAIIANVVLHECGYCGDRQQELTAACLVNRLFSPDFKENTIRELVCAPKQYLPSYCENLPDPNDPDENVQRAFRAALRAARRRVDCPANVVYQANFPQGSGIYEVIEYRSEWWGSTTWFCYA
jgi:hypothetical protein